MEKLVIEDDEGRTTVVPMLRDEITIGRKEGNLIRLTERNVSRRHARLFKQNGSLLIEDLESYNGIRVNGVRIQGRAQLKEGDRVQIGDYVIALRSDTETRTPRIEGLEDAPRDTPTPLEGQPTEQIRLTDIAAGEPTRRMEVPSESRHEAKPTEHDALATQPFPPIRTTGSTEKPTPVVAVSKPMRTTSSHAPVKAKRPSIAPIAAVGLGAIGLGTALWIMDRESAPPTSAIVDSPSVQVAPKATEPPLADLLQQVEQSHSAEDWDKVLELCEQILSRSPGHEMCSARRARAQVERNGKIAFAAFEQAAANSDFDRAVARWNEISEESVYKARGQARYDEIKRAHIENVLAKMSAATKSGQCDEARRLRDQIAVVDENNARAASIWRKGCEVAVVRKPKEPTEEPPEAVDPAKVAEALSEAEAAFVRNEHAQAIRLARSALKMQPGNEKAWRIIGASSCYLKDRDAVLKAYRRLNENNRNLLRYTCQRNGVTID